MNFFFVLFRIFSHLSNQKTNFFICLKVQREHSGLRLDKRTALLAFKQNVKFKFSAIFHNKEGISYVPFYLEQTESRRVSKRFLPLTFLISSPFKRTISSSVKVLLRCYEINNFADKPVEL